MLFCVIGVVGLSGCRTFSLLPLVLSSLLLFIISLILRVVSPPFLLLIVISALLLLPLLLFLSFVSFPLIVVISPMSSSCSPHHRVLLVIVSPPPQTLFPFIDIPPPLLRRLSSSSSSSTLLLVIDPPAPAPRRLCPWVRLAGAGHSLSLGLVGSPPHNVLSLLSLLPSLLLSSSSSIHWRCVFGSSGHRGSDDVGGGCCVGLISLGMGWGRK